MATSSASLTGPELEDNIASSVRLGEGCCWGLGSIGTMCFRFGLIVP